MEEQEEVEGVGAKECISERERGETERGKLGRRAVSSSDPNTSEKEETPNLFPCPRRGRGPISACGRPQESFKFWRGKESECARVPA